MTQPIPSAKDKTLFTPGPLTTSRTVKQAMLQDLGSRDTHFMQVVREIRQELLRIAQVPEDGYVTVLLQGSGTYGIEAVLSTVTPPDGKWLIVVNGAYGRRAAAIAETLHIDHTVLDYPEDDVPDAAEVDAVLVRDASITHVAVVHCETTSGIMNPIDEIGQVVKRHERSLFVDAMSSFGAVPINLAALNIDYLVSSANKCIEGVPGFCFVLARREALSSCEGFARSVSLDLLSQLVAFDQTGQFRFTPPTHALLAFRQALRELEAEGGVEGRAARYHRNYETLMIGMGTIGFEPYLDPEKQGHIITTFRYPDHPHFDFATFYRILSHKGFVIYPGKVTQADCFRIGSIGRIDASDVQALLAAIRAALVEMDVCLS